MSRRGWLLFASMCVIWGIPYLLIKVAVRDITPSMLVLARTALGAALLLPIAAFRGQLRAVLRRPVPLVAFAGIEIALPWILLGTAEQHISSSLTGLLLAGVPLVATVLAWTGGRERLAFHSGVGLLLGVLGVASILGLDVQGASAAGVVEIGAVAVCYAVGPVILQRWLADLPPLGVIGASLGVTALAYVPITAVAGVGRAPSGAVVGSVLALAVVCTALAFVVFFALIAEIGPVRATVITYVNPAVAGALGVVVLDERFTVGMGVGFALVLAGSVLATRPPHPPAASGAAALDPACEPGSL